MNTEEALRWIANLFEEQVENITPETPREKIEAWDSLGILTLMAALNENFDIILSENEIQELRKVGDIFAVLSDRGKLD